MGALQLSTGHTPNGYPTGVSVLPGATPAPARPVALLLPGGWLLHLPRVLQRLDISFREPAASRAQKQREMSSRQPRFVALQIQPPSAPDLHPSHASTKPLLPLPRLAGFLHIFYPSLGGARGYCEAVLELGAGLAYLRGHAKSMFLGSNAGAIQEELLRPNAITRKPKPARKEAVEIPSPQGKAVPP